MVYISKKDFSIHNYIPLQEYFEVDDLIAKTISVLNKKGYYTEYCCSGHILEESKMKIKKEINSLTEIPNDAPYKLIKKRKNKFLVEFYPLGASIYIKFNKEIRLLNIPEDMLYDNNTVYYMLEYFDKDLNKIIDSDIILKIKNINKILYEWAVSLPKA